MGTLVDEERSVWQLQTAKAQLSKVVNRALADEPQLITRGGRPAVYVVAAETYEAEHGGGPNRKDVLLCSPHRGVKLKLTRDKSDGREVAL